MRLTRLLASFCTFKYRGRSCRSCPEEEMICAKPNVFLNPFIGKTLARDIGKFLAVASTGID